MDPASNDGERGRPSRPGNVGRATETLRESARLALDSVRTETVRSGLAVMGIVIGIVTVVLVASVLVNVRNQIALLFRELGTENVFAFHLTGDPYATASEREARRVPLEVSWAGDLARLGGSIQEVAVQVIVPTVAAGTPLVARAGPNESDTVLVEGVSANFFEIAGAAFAAGRPFTELEDRAAARVAIVGASLARALFGTDRVLGRTVTIAGERYIVVGALEKRQGGFFGENRQDSVLALPAGTVTRRFGRPERVVLYARARPGELQRAYGEVEAILRRLRQLPPDAPNDFSISTAEQIIGTLDEVSRTIWIATVGLAAVSLLIGAIGIANVMVIGVTERTREIGVRLALGARRRTVLAQFLLEAAMLSAIGGIAGVGLALLAGGLIKIAVSQFSAVPPLWAIVAGLVTSVTVGLAAGYWPARRAAALDPVEALRHE
jgi:putative ABC transport system permease protein